MKENAVLDIRDELVSLYEREKFVVDKSGCRLLEVVSASFVADEECVFGRANREYISREIAWYESQKLNVNDIPGEKIPEAWLKCATPDGRINSNYGWCIWSTENGSQYDHVLEELRTKPDSRRAIAIYTRPSMWTDYNRDGMSDFCCTNAVQYFIRDGVLSCDVSMRSNDCIWGYANDRAWQAYALEKLGTDLGISTGRIFWHAGSFHVYERHFHLVECYARTGELYVARKEWETVRGDI